MELFKEQLHAHCHFDSRYCHPVDPGSTTPFVESDFPPGAPQIAEVCNPVPQVAVAVFRMCPAPLIELALHVEEPGFISLITQVHGWFLRLRNSVGSLPAFAMYTAFPCSDYYAGSAPCGGLRWSPWLARGCPERPSKVPMFRVSTYCPVGGVL